VLLINLIGFREFTREELGDARAPVALGVAGVDQEGIARGREAEEVAFFVGDFQGLGRG
jgi:hypothetical protein